MEEQRVHARGGSDAVRDPMDGAAGFRRAPSGDRRSHHYLTPKN